jgi:hypothetical protein
MDAAGAMRWTQSSFMGRERLSFLLHNTPLHIDDDERPEGDVGAIIAFDAARAKLIFNDGVGEVHARLCAFGGGGEVRFCYLFGSQLQTRASADDAPAWEAGLVVHRHEHGVPPGLSLSLSLSLLHPLPI